MTEHVTCPYHQKRALKIIKMIKGRKYAYARHRWYGRLLDCYLGKEP